MIVTTAGRTTETMIEKAKQVAKELNLRYINRNENSIKMLQACYHTDVFVVGKERFEIYEKGHVYPFFFHPNSAMFRVKRILRGEIDPFISTANLQKGMTLLDCTLGLASDSIVASVAAGDQGNVVGIENNHYIAYLVKAGLAEWDSGLPEMNEGMNRIKVIKGHHLDVLRSLPVNSFDIVYFDPMFEENIESSNGISALRNFASYESMTQDVIDEAKRVAKQRVVLKDHWKSNRFETFGFTVFKRPTATFHFATIEV
ncbi:class I SAM-dependent methyltransferase [Anaerobacillus sp. MEB173]|uniref:class I SAM-dependent methyltransferase n=1 Tax=Anaerobacillus sp. MEB173 TaxID=3383345 RepID=UPI003F93B4BD